MPQIWNQYPSLPAALEDISEENTRGINSIPDVYGKAIHFYMALRDAESSGKDEVRLWRGLVTLLALQNYLDLPLAWNRVELPEQKDEFCKALSFPLENITVFSDQHKQWDGKRFYALTWTKPSGAPVDLLIYSPATLVYPTADWRAEFAQISGLRWFDYSRRCFLDPVSVLRESEKKIVFYWLEEMTRELKDPVNGAHGGKTANTVLSLLRHYQEELGVESLSEREKKCLSRRHITHTINQTDWFAPLNDTVSVTLRFNNDSVDVNEFFSEQLCLFKTDKENPFKNCDSSTNYKVDNSNYFALLPFHPRMREHCKRFHLDQCVRMELLADGRSILAHVKMPGDAAQGMDLEREYRLYIDESGREAVKQKKNVALEYKQSDSSQPPIPQIAVWPKRICEAWKRYYILLMEDDSLGELEIDSSGAMEDREKYVVLTKYVPYAIPLVRRVENNRVSVGTIMPTSTNSPQVGGTAAEVAVDFGTCSTIVFAKVGGKITQQEIDIREDTALEVTPCEDVQMLRDYFIAPKNSDGEGTACGLFSIYRRNSDEEKDIVRPILDGVIYRPAKDQKIDQFKYFMPDLKWNAAARSGYYMAFIRQLCLHAAALLYDQYSVTKFTWKYALPESMNSRDKEAVTRIWTRDVDKYLSEIAGPAISSQIAAVPVTESEAASWYFLFGTDRPVNPEIGYLVVDIGGGSTDVALWKGASMIWHTSVNVAGRKMFTHRIARHIDRFKVLGGSLSVLIEAIERSGPESNIQYALTERCLNFYDQEMRTYFLRICSEEASERNKWAKELYESVYQALAMLVFALGCDIGRLIDSRAYEPTEGAGNLTIAFGGRGSRILDWIDPDIDGLSAFFGEGLIFGVGGTYRQINVKLYPSPAPKQEVARGLLNQPTKPATRREEGALGNMFDLSNGADVFRKTFNTQCTSRSAPQLPAFDQNDLADYLASHIGNRNSAVNTFMEIVYDKYLCTEEAWEENENDTD